MSQKCSSSSMSHTSLLYNRVASILIKYLVQKQKVLLSTPPTIEHNTSSLAYTFMKSNAHSKWRGSAPFFKLIPPPLGAIRYQISATTSGEHPNKDRNWRCSLSAFFPSPFLFSESDNKLVVLQWLAIICPKYRNTFGPVLPCRKAHSIVGSWIDERLVCNSLYRYIVRWHRVTACFVTERRKELTNLNQLHIPTNSNKNRQVSHRVSQTLT